MSHLFGECMAATVLLVALGFAPATCRADDCGFLIRIATKLAKNPDSLRGAPLNDGTYMSTTPIIPAHQCTYEMDEKLVKATGLKRTWYRVNCVWLAQSYDEGVEDFKEIASTIKECGPLKDYEEDPVAADGLQSASASYRLPEGGLSVSLYLVHEAAMEYDVQAVRKVYLTFLSHTR